ncbi:MAG: hypothetical protein ACXVWW_12510 [Nocardioides sp.]
MSTARVLTSAYETWLGEHIALDRSALADERRQLRSDRLRRGASYR